MSALGVWMLINSCGLQDHYEDFCGVLEIVEDAYSAYNALETQSRKGELGCCEEGAYQRKFLNSVTESPDKVVHPTFRRQHSLLEAAGTWS